MNIKYVSANKEDADLVVKIYDLSFYDDYMKYGECPAFGRTKEIMEKSIEEYPKLIIYSDDIPVGAISVGIKENGEYYLGCLCVIPEFQGKGIGSQAIKFMLNYYSDWKKITLITPIDKEENITFYTKKCGFQIDGTQMDGNIKVVHFSMER